MKRLLLLALTSSSWALPPDDEVLRLLLSENTKDRNRITAEIWAAGESALPLVKKLSQNDDPEVASRTGSIYRRLRIGLNADSPEALLQLSADLESDPFGLREHHLLELLDHAGGVPVAVAFMNLQSKDPQEDDEQFSLLTGRITGAVLEQRNYWQTFFTRSLTTRTRAAVIADLANRDMPMNHRMITCLAISDPIAIYPEAVKFNPKLTTKCRIALARAALVKNENQLAIQILTEGLPFAEEETLARKIAFLEIATGTESQLWNGKWKYELSILRARATGDLELAGKLADQLPSEDLLRLETKIICGPHDIPRESHGIGDLENSLLNAFEQFFSRPSIDPDIEALSSTVTGRYSVLAKSLLVLGHPREASETLTGAEEETDAVTLLWHAGLRNQAETLAKKSLENQDNKTRVEMCLTLAGLAATSGDLEKAKNLLLPLGEEQIQRKTHLRQALRLASQLELRQLSLDLIPDMSKSAKHLRAMPVSATLPYPSGVSIFWYERFRKQDPQATADELLNRVIDLVENKKEEALKVISAEYAAPGERALFPTDHLFQNAFFFHAPCALDIGIRSAWRRMEVRELLQIAQSDQWPAETREKAQEAAQLIHPGEPHATAVNHANFGALTFGNAENISLLARTEKHQTLAKQASRLLNLRNGFDLQILRSLATFLTEKGDFAEVPDLVRIAVMGEIAHGPQRGSSYQNLLSLMRAYCQAKNASAKNDDAKSHWQELGKRYGATISAPAGSSPAPSKAGDVPASK